MSVNAVGVDILEDFEFTIWDFGDNDLGRRGRPCVEV